MEVIIGKLGWTGMLLTVVLFLSAVSVAADSPVGSITVFYHGVTPQEESIALSGAEFSLYPVGSYEEGKWNLKDEFASCGVSLTDSSASGRYEAAQKLYAFVQKQQTEGVQQTTNASGYAVFEGLEEGLYLLAPTGDVTLREGVFRSDPFLAQIPETGEDGTLSYDITVEPKNEWAADKEEEENPAGGFSSAGVKTPDTSSSSKGSVKTGDNTPVGFLAGILTVSTALIFSVLILSYRKSRIGQKKL